MLTSKIILVQTEEDYTNFLSDFHGEQRSMAVDTETNGLTPYKGTRLIGISFYFPSTDRAYYLPFRHNDGNDLYSGVLDDLRNNWNTRFQVGRRAQHHALTASMTRVIYFNALFDLHVMTQDGFVAPSATYDVMIAAKLLNENEAMSHGNERGAYTLKRLARKYLGEWAGAGEAELSAAAKARGLNPKSEMYKMPSSEVYYYASFDTIITHKLFEFYLPHLHRWQHFELFEEECAFLRNFLFRAEYNGVAIDREVMQQQKADAERRCAGIQKIFSEACMEQGITFDTKKIINLDSPLQVAGFFKRIVGIELHNTGVDYMAILAREGNTWAQLLLEYRDYATPIKLYYKKYEQYLNEQNFMHPNHMVAGARTGRLTCSSPNTAQISKKGDFKKIFVPRSEDFLKVSMDLKQAELRVAAHYCQEETMLHLMRNGIDMHQYTADALTEMLGRPISRQLGKMANFGLLYRMSGPKAAVKFGIDLELANDLVSGWRRLYSGFDRGYQTAVELAQQWRNPRGETDQPDSIYQYFRLPLDGRVRHFHEALQIRKLKMLNGMYDVYPGEVYEEYGQEKVAEEAIVLTPYDEHYKAFNFLVQGTIQVVMRRGLLKLMQKWSNDIVKPQMIVYDSAVFDVHQDVVHDFANSCREIMYFPEFTIPLSVDVEAGPNYKELEAI